MSSKLLAMFQKVSQLRKSISLTQDELANRLSINRGTYANYERGHRQPDFETLQKIVDYFDVTSDYLLGRTDKPKLINYNFNTDKNTDMNQQEFEAWLNDTRFSKLYKESNESDEERRDMLLALWGVINTQKK